jgi:SAM-dependent methyltransferase
VLTVALSLLSACVAAVTPIVAAPPTRDASSQTALDLPALHRYFTADDVLTSLPAPRLLGVERVDAFEDHECFAYVFGTTAGVVRRIFFLRPNLIVIDDQVDSRSAGRAIPILDEVIPGAAEASHFRTKSLLPSSTEAGASNGGKTAAWARSLQVIGFAKNGEPSLPACSARQRRDDVRLEVVENDAAADGRTIRLWLPTGPASGRIEILGRDEKELVSKRLLPGGILPPDLGAWQRRLQWDLPYKASTETVWDTGHASTELKRMVETGQIKPCRTVEIGCGTGSDAIYLASRGFDVTAIDIAPTALNIAERKAEQAGARVNWLLADVLHPPQLEAFDFAYDRGCYHEVRQHAPQAYVAAVRRLTHDRSKILILAGNANNDTYWRFEGPPRVREQDIRSDFADVFRLLQLREFRFDPARGQKQGALAWSILLQRGE